MIAVYAQIKLAISSALGFPPLGSFMPGLSRVTRVGQADSVLVAMQMVYIR